jgi:hypothetical protein
LKTEPDAQEAKWPYVSACTTYNVQHVSVGVGNDLLQLSDTLDFEGSWLSYLLTIRDSRKCGELNLSLYYSLNILIPL